MRVKKNQARYVHYESAMIQWRKGESTMLQMRNDVEREQAGLYQTVV